MTRASDAAYRALVYITGAPARAMAGEALVRALKDDGWDIVPACECDCIHQLDARRAEATCACDCDPRLTAENRAHHEWVGVVPRCAVCGVEA